MLLRHLGCAVASLLLVASATRAAAEGAEKPPGPPAAVFKSIERAWLAGDARALSKHFGDRKVSISLPEAGPVGGRFSRNQSYFILKDHFQATKTQQFQFIHVREPGEAQRVAAALARRVYRNHGNGRVVRDRVLVALVRDGDRWVVSEVKALR
ncbi:MAG: DUF4783 domain-containing protein [Candidatus Krumholzibacteriia bacterium]